MKKILFLFILFTVSTHSFSQETAKDKNKANSTRSRFNKSFLHVGDINKQEEVFFPGEKYLWIFKNIENESDKEVIEKMKIALTQYTPVISNEVYKENELTFSVSFSGKLTYAELTEKMNSAKIRVTSKDKNKTEPAGNKPVAKIAN